MRGGLARPSGDGPNSYAFVGNNPVQWFDSNGLEYGTGFAAWYECVGDCKAATSACLQLAGIQALVVGGILKKIPYINKLCGAAAGGTMAATCLKADTACKTACEKKTKYKPKPGTPRP